MVSHVVDVMLHGVFASLTGGWFYNLHNDILINTLHMYLWIILGLLPFIIYLTVSQHQANCFLLSSISLSTAYLVSVQVHAYKYLFLRDRDPNS